MCVWLKPSELAEYRGNFIIYIAWQLGVATNQQIGERFGLTYSSVSQRARLTKKKLSKDRELAIKYQHIKSLMKI